MRPPPPPPPNWSTAAAGGDVATATVFQTTALVADRLLIFYQCTKYAFTREGHVLMIVCSTKVEWCTRVYPDICTLLRNNLSYIRTHIMVRMRLPWFIYKEAVKIFIVFETYFLEIRVRGQRLRNRDRGRRTHQSPYL